MKPAAEHDRFVTSFKGKHNVIVDRSEDHDDESVYFFIKLTDDADQELLIVDANENPTVRDLSFLARRKSLNVDAAIDEIISGPLPAFLICRPA